MIRPKHLRKIEEKGDEEAWDEGIFGEWEKELNKHHPLGLYTIISIVIGVIGQALFLNMNSPTLFVGCMITVPILAFLVIHSLFYIWYIIAALVITGDLFGAYSMSSKLFYSILLGTVVLYITQRLIEKQKRGAGEAKSHTRKKTCPSCGQIIHKNFCKYCGCDENGIKVTSKQETKRDPSSSSPNSYWGGKYDDI